MAIYTCALPDVIGNAEMSHGGLMLDSWRWAPYRSVGGFVIAIKLRDPGFCQFNEAAPSRHLFAKPSNLRLDLRRIGTDMSAHSGPPDRATRR
jgi:hypothetical protein